MEGVGGSQIERDKSESSQAQQRASIHSRHTHHPKPIQIMQRIIHLVVCWFLCGLAVATNFAEETKEKIKVLLVTGGHGFEVEPFFKIFSDNQEITFTAAKHGKDADVYDRPDLLSYDVVVLYDMARSITDAQRKQFLALLEKGTGLVVLHHALVSYPD